jgi:hypothetical protein
MVFHYNAQTHATRIHAYTRDNNMKIRTSIIVDLGYKDEIENVVIEISEDFSEYTCFKNREHDEQEKYLFSCPNNKLRDLVEAINEHIKIHGL